MKPSALMMLGASLGVFALVVTAMAEDAAVFSVLLFASGAIFGKGYGVWEERSRTPNVASGGRDDD